jgi:ElaA protein
MIRWSVTPFAELSARDFHDLIQLRIGVFVVEQNCPYPELDGKDLEAFHLIGRLSSGEIVATARILSPGISYPEASIGRVCSRIDQRGNGSGKMLMQKALDAVKALFGEVPVRISAQHYLLSYYKHFGFEPQGEVYLEDDIPHIEMLFGPLK